MSSATAKLPLPRPSHSKISSISKNLPSPNVQVTFSTKLSTLQIVENINNLTAPHIVLWYIGCCGLKAAGVDFYRECIISPILFQNPDATLWLLDLTAWAAFKNQQASISNSSGCCDTIEQLLQHRMQCIRSADIFKRMINLSDKPLLSYFRKALQRTFISRKSKSFPKTNIKIQEIFPNPSSLISAFNKFDTNAAYSTFQYLEGCLIVERIFLEQLKKHTTNLELVFALPNDELEYYRDLENSFQKDIQFLLSFHCEKQNIKHASIHIQFLSFEYGKHQQDRPYNNPGTNIRKTQLSYEKIAGERTIAYSAKGIEYATCST